MPGKLSINQLAALGGAAEFDAVVCVGRPNHVYRREFYTRLDAVFDRGWLSNGGPCVSELESRIADMLEVRQCVVVANATLGLQLMAKAAGLSGEVIMPAFTFAATAQAMDWIGLKPVFCDVDPDTHNLDPKLVAECITPRTSAILGVHLWGGSCDVAALDDLADRHRLSLLFDAAHAFGCSRKGLPIGGNGLAEVFSFHATKFFSACEGGAVCTNDEELASRMRNMINFGFALPEQLVSCGTNAKMSELSAAMALTNLDHFADILECNRRNFAAYSAGLAGIPGLTLIRPADGQQRNNQYIVVRVDETVAGLSRDQLLEFLSAENVGAKRYFYPGLHRQPPFMTAGTPAAHCPVTDLLSHQVMQLPTGTSVTPDDIGRICGLIRLMCAQAGEIRRRLTARVSESVERTVPGGRALGSRMLSGVRRRANRASRPSATTAEPSPIFELQLPGVPLTESPVSQAHAEGLGPNSASGAT
jgi:dTDP-4-amino-4,6-dideoxyglucose